MLGEIYTEYQGKRRKRREHQRQRYWLPGDCFRQYPGYFGQSECHGRVAGPSGENTHTMGSFCQYNEEALNNKISNLSCISGGSIVTTKDASISAYEEGKEFTIVPAVQGNDVDPEKTKQVITAVVRAGSRETFPGRNRLLPYRWCLGK